MDGKVLSAILIYLGLLMTPDSRFQNPTASISILESITDEEEAFQKLKIAYCIRAEFLPYGARKRLE
jgi:hypothetical protein